MGVIEEFTVVPTATEGTEGTGELSSALGALGPEVRERAVLLIRELGACVPTTRDDVTLHVRVLAEPEAVRVEVRDRGTGLVLGSLRQAPDDSMALGWSPHLLSSVADRWGLVSGPDGAWVWFELDTDDRAG